MFQYSTCIPVSAIVNDEQQWRQKATLSYTLQISHAAE